MTIRIILFLFIAATGLALNSCSEDENQNELQPDTMELDARTGEDLAQGQDVLEDVEAEVDRMLETRGSGQNCATVTVVPDDGSFPRIVTIDYGPDGCTGPHGRLRKGQIVVEVSDTLRKAGSTRTVTLVDFSIDGAAIEGSKTLTNLSTDDRPSFGREASFRIDFPDGSNANWTTNQTYSIIEGSDTPTRLDDVIQVEGSFNGTNREGGTFAANVTEPLTKRKWCRFVERGVVDIDRNGRQFTIDFGNGACDRFATILLPNGRERTISLRPWWL
jgi:hypothetical protein